MNSVGEANRSGDSRWVTTVIPTFERCGLLRRAMLSVLKQSHPWTQVTVFDNRSSDDTVKVAEELASQYPGRVQFHLNESNIGPLLNFDRAIRSVQTPFFTIMSDDDVLLPGFVESALDQLDRNPSADIACGRTWAVTEAGEILNRAPLGFPIGLHHAPQGAELMLTYQHPPWQGMLFRANVLETCHGLNPEIEGFDVDFLVRSAAIHSIVFYADDVALFLRHKGSATFDLNLKYIYPSYLKMLGSIEEDLQISEEFKAFARREVPARLERVLRPYILRGSVEDSPQDFEFALRGLIEGRDTKANRRLVALARALQRFRFLRRTARLALAARRTRIRARVASATRGYDFSSYVRQ